ncbi:SH3 domain-containing protein [Fusibacter bizertensis]|uniref:SH3 domain-containing protein n=1 Tax=Fusibacter bizertensis TaxID=1488331 RepID=A0ABT6NGD7_9FIRM|nr:SH3 domain-containing protein [Fusibacter bizertensis]MDH8679457.1 SH3 domain-containing protein [Fusibacter bizertensis]
MKKYLVVLLCIVMALSAIGCSGEEKSMNSTQETTNEVVTSANNNEATTEKMESEESNSVRVLTDVLNVRDGHNLDSNVIGKLEKDAVVEVQEIYFGDEGKQWLKIIDGDTTGWIAEWYCIDNYEYENKILKNNLLPAYEGKVPTIKGSMSSTFDEIKSLYNDKLELTQYWGSPGLYNDDVLYQFGDSDLVFISVTPKESIYGVSPSMSIEDVRGIVGEPNLQVTVDDPEGMAVYEDGSIILSYFTGAYTVEFVFNTDSQLTHIGLSKPVLESSNSNASKDSSVAASNSSNSKSSFKEKFNQESWYNSILYYEENPTEDYAKACIAAFEDKVKDMLPQMEEVDMPKAEGYMGTYDYKDLNYFYPNIDTVENTLNVYEMEEPFKSHLVTFGEDEIFIPALIAYATEGNVQSDKIGVTIRKELIKPIQEMYKKIGKSMSEVSMNIQPLYLPTENWNSNDQYIQSSDVTYPKVFIDNYEALSKFDGADTWKVEVIYPLEVVDQFSLED